MLEIEIKVDWDQVQTDLSECTQCGEVIYSDMYVEILFVNNHPNPTGKKLCEACYNDKD